MSSASAYADLSDKELMRRIKRDELAAFESLYARFAPTALGIARGFCRTPDRAEDAVQEGFLSLWRARERYDPERGDVHSWVFQIIRYAAIDAARASGRHEARRENDDGIDGENSGDADVLAAVVKLDEAQRLRAILRRLPSKHTEVIELAFFEQLSHSEIARRLDLPLGTVKGRIRLGYELLRRQIAA